MLEKDVKNYTVLKDITERNPDNILCDKCKLNDKDESTFSFSCCHNLCINCIFNYFILNKFKGLKLELLTLNCPICQYGSAKFSLETWFNILNQLFLKRNMKNGGMKEKDKNKNILCTVHKKNNCYKYCYQCQKNICEACEKSHINHLVIDINDAQFYQLDDFGDGDGVYKSFEENLKKKENIFYEKIENDYILKKIKIEELIRKLNILLNEFTLKMNIFQKNMQNIFHIINISYYIYFNKLKKEEDKNKLILNDKLLDIRFIFHNSIDLNDLSNYFNKKLNNFDTTTNSNLTFTKENTENLDSDISKIFDYELIWSESPPKQKYVLKFTKEEEDIVDSITKIIQLNSIENLLAAAQTNGIINIWSLNTKKIVLELKKHKSAVWTIIENSEGYLISGGSDNIIKIWDVNNKRENCLINIKGHKGAINSICELEKDKIISGSDDKTIKIWKFDLYNKKNPYQCVLDLHDPNNSKIKSLVYLNRTNTILTGNDDNLIKLYSLSQKTQAVTNILNGHNCTVWCLLPFYEDSRLASGSTDNSIKIWDLINWRCLYTLEGYENTISSLVMLKNDFLGSSSWDHTCKIWNLENRKCIYTFAGHKDIVWCIIELRNCDLATCSNDKNIIIWEKS